MNLSPQARYFHGSKNHGIACFSFDSCDENHPFGPAIYLTRDIEVAGCYSGDDGVIYEVTLSGNLDLTIDLDSPWIMQSIQAKQAILKIIKDVQWCVEFKKNINTRSLLSGVIPSRKELNSRLRNAGIWMIYGELGADESSGFLDSGVQYAVIDVCYANINRTI